MVTDADRPVQFVRRKMSSGKWCGERPSAELDHLSRDPRLQGRLRFVEGYDMELGRALVSGVDVWMNTPRRPREASGTSGMKAAMNGVPSLSILDGWWCEGYNEANGWAFGMTELDVDPAHRDAVDGEALMETLENKVIPAYYEEGRGTSDQWISLMKESIRVGVQDFNTERMLQQYVKMYCHLEANRTDSRSQSNQSVKSDSLPQTWMRASSPSDAPGTGEHNPLRPGTDANLRRNPRESDCHCSGYTTRESLSQPDPLRRGIRTEPLRCGNRGCGQCLRFLRRIPCSESVVRSPEGSQAPIIASMEKLEVKRGFTSMTRAGLCPRGAKYPIRKPLDTPWRRNGTNRSANEGHPRVLPNFACTQ